jgi:hypothetical protein
MVDGGRTLIVKESSETVSLVTTVYEGWLNDRDVCEIEAWDVVFVVVAWCQKVARKIIALFDDR